MKNSIIFAIAFLCAFFCSNTVQADIGMRTNAVDVFTLYRSSAIRNGETWRLHVATFDAKDGKEYNNENCEIARELFQKQPDVTVHYWCEKGYFKK